MMLHRVFVAGCLVSILAGPAVAAEAPEDLAQKAAESWLKLVDDGDYVTSWKQASRVFKRAVQQVEWGRAVAGVRTPLGKLVSRRLRSRDHTERMPGAPDGKYFLIRYDAVFENKAAAIETVVPMVDPDGTWRVSGYWIR